MRGALSHPHRAHRPWTRPIERPRRACVSQMASGSTAILRHHVAARAASPYVGGNVGHRVETCLPSLREAVAEATGRFRGVRRPEPSSCTARAAGPGQEPWLSCLISSLFLADGASGRPRMSGGPRRSCPPPALQTRDRGPQRGCPGPCFTRLQGSWNWSPRGQTTASLSDPEKPDCGLDTEASPREAGRHL